MLIAANLFAAGGETTARLLGTMLQLLGERPELQQQLRDDRDLHPEASSRRRCGSRARSRASSGWRASPTTVGGVDLPAGTTVMVLNGAANRDPRAVRGPDRAPTRPRRTAASTSGSGSASTPARARRSRGPRPASASSASSTAWPTSGSRRRRTAPPDARRYEYSPIYMLRGLEQLHLEFTPITDAPTGACMTAIQTASRLYIDGSWVDAASDEGLDVINPATEEVIAQVPQASVADIDRAVAAARRRVRRRSLAEDVTTRALRRARAVRADDHRPTRGAGRAHHRRGGRGPIDRRVPAVRHRPQVPRRGSPSAPRRSRSRNRSRCSRVRGASGRA